MNRKGTGKLREINDQKVLKYFLDYKVGTKKSIAKATQLSVMTIGTILNTFLKDDIICEKELVYPHKGRPTQQFQMNKDYFHLLIFIVRKENNQYYLSYQIKNALSEVIQENKEFVHKMDSHIIISKIKSIVNNDKLIKEIGIGVPGIISHSIIVDSDITELKGVHLKEELKKEISIPIHIFNDMNCTAYGYYRLLQNKEDICFITFPKKSGPGCGSVINGRLLAGINNIAGEIAYLPFFKYLENNEFEYSMEQMVMSLACVSSILNPRIIYLTGDGVKLEDIQTIEKKCLRYIPKEFMPHIEYIEKYDDYYLYGIETLLVDDIA